MLDASGRLVHSAELSVPGPTMMHDFMITREHAVFMDLPVVFSLERAARGEVPLFWDESYGARVGILPRRGGDAEVRWFEIDPCYVFHPMNAYAEGSKVICDVGRHAYMWRESMNDFAPSCLWRWSFDLETRQGERAAARRRGPTPSPASTTAWSACATATAGRSRRGRDTSRAWARPGSW